MFNKKIFSGKENLLGMGRRVLINGNWDNLSLGLPEIKETVESINLEIKHKALPMIIPAKPIFSNEQVRNFVPKFRPSNVIANN